MMKENSSFEILGFAFVRRLPWIRCWFLPGAGGRFVALREIVL
jgi:hypothetical protein